MHSAYANLQVYVGGYAYQLVELHVQLQLDLVLCLHLGECANGWDHMHVHNGIHALQHSCM